MLVRWCRWPKGRGRRLGVAVTEPEPVAAAAPVSRHTFEVAMEAIESFGIGSVSGDSFVAEFVQDGFAEEAAAFANGGIVRIVEERWVDFGK